MSDRGRPWTEAEKLAAGHIAAGRLRNVDACQVARRIFEDPQIGLVSALELEQAREALGEADLALMDALTAMDPETAHQYRSESAAYNRFKGALASGAIAAGDERSSE